MIVYLSGPISGLTYEGAEGWREYASRVLRRYGIDTLDPLRGKADLARGGVVGSDFDVRRAVENSPPGPLRTARAIHTLGRWDVKRADIVLANLQDATRVSIGTCMEIAWAGAYGTPVVAVIRRGSIHNHSLLTEACGFLAQTLDDALNLLPVILGVVP